MVVAAADVKGLGWSRSGPRLDVWDTRTFTRPTDGVATDYVHLVTAMGTKKLAKLAASPDAIADEKLLFASLISDRDDKTATVGNVGLILGAGPDNVAGTCHQDTSWYMSTNYMTYEDVAKRISQQYPPENPGFGNALRARPAGTPHVIHTPRELLDGTVGNNEVLLVGRREISPSTVRATGVFIRTQNGKDLANKEEIAAFTAIAKKWGVPLVRIPVPPRKPRAVNAVDVFER